MAVLTTNRVYLARRRVPLFMPDTCRVKVPGTTTRDDAGGVIVGPPTTLVYPCSFRPLTGFEMAQPEIIRQNIALKLWLPFDASVPATATLTIDGYTDVFSVTFPELVPGQAAAREVWLKRR